jgi:hypothetical protein
VEASLALRMMSGDGKIPGKPLASLPISPESCRPGGNGNYCGLTAIR